MTKEQIIQARLERNPQPWEIDDFILAMCERQRAEDSKDIANLQHIAKSEKDNEKEIAELKEQIENQRLTIRQLDEELKDLKAQNIELLTKDRQVAEPEEKTYPAKRAAPKKTKLKK